jgi:hypothetical protein
LKILLKRTLPSHISYVLAAYSLLDFEVCNLIALLSISYSTNKFQCITPLTTQPTHTNKCTNISTFWSRSLPYTFRVLQRTSAPTSPCLQLSHMFTYKHVSMYLYKGRGKAIPLQTLTGPELSRRLRLPDFKKSAQENGKFVSPTLRPPLPEANIPCTYFC